MAALSTLALGSLIGASAIGGAVNSVRRGRYEQSVANTNAALAEMQADDAERRGGLAALRHQGETRTLIGAQRAAGAASGVDLSSGSIADLQAEAAFLGELDALTIRNNAAREAWGYRAEAAGLRDAGRAARQAGEFGAYQSLLAGGITAYGMFRNR